MTAYVKKILRGVDTPRELWELWAEVLPALVGQSGPIASRIVEAVVVPQMAEIAGAPWVRGVRVGWGGREGCKRQHYQAALARLWRVVRELEARELSDADRTYFAGYLTAVQRATHVDALLCQAEEARRLGLGISLEQLHMLTASQRRAVIDGSEMLRAIARNGRAAPPPTPCEPEVCNTGGVRLNPSGVTHTVSPDCGSTGMWVV